MRSHPYRQIDPWDAHSGAPRVLVEEADGAMAWAMSDALREAGFQVVTCRGPDARERVECPLVRGEGCEAAETADLVVCDLLTCDGADDVIAALRSRGRSTPILRGFPFGHRAFGEPADAGVTPLPLPYRADELVEAATQATRTETGQPAVTG